MAEHLIRKYRTASPEEKAAGNCQNHIAVGTGAAEIFFFGNHHYPRVHAYPAHDTRGRQALLPDGVDARIRRDRFHALAALTFIPVLISFAYKKALADPDKPMKEHKNFVLDFSYKVVIPKHWAAF